MKVILCFVFTWVISFNVFAKQQEVIFGVGNENNEHTLYITKLLIKTIGEKLNIKTKIIQLPNNQLTWLLKNEKIHAELYRVKAYQKVLPQTIMIKEPIIELPYYAYSTNKDIKVNSWRSLLPYQHVTVREFKFANTWLANHNTHELGNVESALKFLSANRAEVFVAHQLAVEKYISQPQFSNIYQLKPQVDSLALHTFFSKSSSAIAQKFEQTIVELKQQGYLEKLIKDLRNKNNNKLTQQPVINTRFSY